MSEGCNVSRCDTPLFAAACAVNNPINKCARRELPSRPLVLHTRARPDDGGKGTRPFQTYILRQSQDSVHMFRQSGDTLVCHLWQCKFWDRPNFQNHCSHYGPLSMHISSIFVFIEHIILEIRTIKPHNDCRARHNIGYIQKFGSSQTKKYHFFKNNEPLIFVFVSTLLMTEAADNGPIIPATSRSDCAYNHVSFYTPSFQP